MRVHDWYGDGSLYVVDVGLACCALEFDAAAAQPHGRSGRATAAADPVVIRPGADVVVVVSGTVTDRLAPAVLEIIQGCATLSGRPPQVISFGACAASGGPYWDSYAVTKGIDQLVLVDLYVPGCPPPPEALHDAIEHLSARVAR